MRATKSGTDTGRTGRAAGKKLRAGKEVSRKPVPVRSADRIPTEAAETGVPITIRIASRSASSLVFCHPDLPFRRQFPPHLASLRQGLLNGKHLSNGDQVGGRVRSSLRQLGAIAWLFRNRLSGIVPSALSSARLFLTGAFGLRDRHRIGSKLRYEGLRREPGSCARRPPASIAGWSHHPRNRSSSPRPPADRARRAAKSGRIGGQCAPPRRRVARHRRSTAVMDGDAARLEHAIRSPRRRTGPDRAISSNTVCHRDNPRRRPTGPRCRVIFR